MTGQAPEGEVIDEELAAAEVNGKLLAVIPLPVWRQIRLAMLDHAVLVAAERGRLAAPDRVRDH